MKAYHPITAITMVLIVFASAPAAALPVSGLGTSQISNFTLGGVEASACVVSAVNPDQGPDGNSLKRLFWGPASESGLELGRD